MNKYRTTKSQSLKTILGIICTLYLCASCASSQSQYYNQLKSENQNDRIRYLIIHHTTIDFEESVRALTKPNGVSAHYLVPDSKDSSYQSETLRVTQLVDEKDRAWHAGLSYWQGTKNLNDQSIGIELVYLSPCEKSNHQTSYPTRLNSDANADNLCFYPDYDEQQIDLLIDLVHDILKRNPEISATHIIGHADITPGRRIDPGPRFPWQRLYKEGIGAWYEQDTVAKYWQQFIERKPSIGLVQTALRAYGYSVVETGILDPQTINALNVFQMHFRPWEVNGHATLETSATLFALIDRYFHKKVERLQRRYEAEKKTLDVEAKLHYLGQFDGRFPSKIPSTREFVNDRKSFKANQGFGVFNVTNQGVTSAKFLINGQSFIKKFDSNSTHPQSIDISKYTRDGINIFQVSDIKPKESHLIINMPFPVLRDSTAKQEGFSTQLLKKVDQLIESDIKKGFPGAQLVIIKNGKLIKNSVYGFSKRYDRNGQSLKQPTKVTKNTLFDLASNTKMYATNYALMKLVSEGKINVTDPINKYLPEYIGQGRESRIIEDLLTHSAGYPATVDFHRKDNKLGERFFSHNKSYTQYLLIQQVPFMIGRGLKSKYSDVDYMLLGTLIERVVGQPLDEYVEENIYQPLGLNHTKFNPLLKNIDLKQTAATELQGNSRGGRIEFEQMRTDVIQGEVHDEKAFYSMAGVAGHAGLFSNAKEIAILASVMLNRGGYGDVSLFDKNTIDQFTKPSDLTDSIGLGWRRAANGVRIWQFGPYASPYAFGHTGWTGTVTIIDPFYDLIIVLLTNKKHTPIIQQECDTPCSLEQPYKFLGDTLETGKYGSVVSLIYEAFLENKVH